MVILLPWLKCSFKIKALCPSSNNAIRKLFHRSLAYVFNNLVFFHKPLEYILKMTFKEYSSQHFEDLDTIQQDHRTFCKIWLRPNSFTSMPTSPGQVARGLASVCSLFLPILWTVQSPFVFCALVLHWPVPWTHLMTSGLSDSELTLLSCTGTWTQSLPQLWPAMAC